VTDVARLLRGALFMTALSAATVFVLPAHLSQAAGVRVPAPDRAAQWWLAALDVRPAWQTVPGQGKGETIALLSTGVDAKHPDLVGNVTTGPDYSHSGRSAGGQFWGAEGTAAAGLIAGHGHGTGASAGIVGVAPHAKILSVRVTLEYNDPLNASDAAITRPLPDAIAAGIKYAVGRGARVIALPLDPGTLGPAATGDPAAAGGSAAERAAVAFALAHDVVLVAPAGDNGAGTGTVNFPAAYPGVIAVAATQKNGQLTPFTSTRSYVALTAPGGDLTVAAPGGGYTPIATTDMSAALTAGVAALIRSRFPHLTATQVTRAVESGHGALNAVRALNAATAIAAVHRAAPASSPAKPKPRPAARHTAASKAASRHADPGTMAGSLLRDAVIAAAILIALLTGVLVASIRWRRARAAAREDMAPAWRGSGQGRNGQGSHTKRTRAAIESGATQTRPTSPGPASAAGRPRISPIPKTGSLGSSGRAPRKQTADRPPWEVQDTGGYAAAPVPADLQDWTTSTGPMYVWNPAAASTTPPIPAPSPQPQPQPHEEP
jgi:hypothetical protein